MYVCMKPLGVLQSPCREGVLPSQNQYREGALQSPLELHRATRDYIFESPYRKGASCTQTYTHRHILVFLPTDTSMLHKASIEKEYCKTHIGKGLCTHIHTYMHIHILVFFLQIWGCFTKLLQRRFFFFCFLKPLHRGGFANLYREEASYTYTYTYFVFFFLYI